MNWKNQLKTLEQKKDWNAAILFMEQVILENANDMNAYISMNYLLMNLLVEEDYDEAKHDYYVKLLKHYFTQSYAKFSWNAEYLFFTGITSFMSEWYFGIELVDGEAMVRKAMELEPGNILYQWAYYGLLDLLRVPENKKIAASYAKIVLEENSPIKEILKSKGAIGAYLLEIMTSWSKHVIRDLE